MGTIPEPLPHLNLKAMNWTVSNFMVFDGQEDHIDLTAPYQRQSVWDTSRRRNLIRSMLMGLPIGAVVYGRLSYDIEKFLRIVDGKQRIEAIRAFADDEFTIPGWWVENRWVNDPADRGRDLTYSQLSATGHRFFENLPFPGLEFDSTFEWYRVDDEWEQRPRTPEEQIAAEAELYLLVNFGGVDQTDADRENAERVAST
jgi:hypothetical protein